jgi:hypothetical protein
MSSTHLSLFFLILYFFHLKIFLLQNNIDMCCQLVAEIANDFVLVMNIEHQENRADIQ